MTAARSFARINEWLLSEGFTIATNPCVSPDFCLNAELLVSQFDSAVAVHKRSGFFTEHGDWRLAEHQDNGDCGWLLTPAGDGAVDCPLDGCADVSGGRKLYPATWANLLKLKAMIAEYDPGATIFPTAAGTLKNKSLGIGARFTTLHWPAVDWAMSALNLSLTANQNSIPRELVYDVDAMLDGTLDSVDFKFIGCQVPEGHQGQSVEGMSHGAVLTKLRHGFHHRRLPWGFNADHQPIGGKFDEREDALVEGCVLASYITFDLSPHLSTVEPVAADAVGPLVDSIPAAVRAKIDEAIDTFGLRDTADAGSESFEGQTFLAERLSVLWPALVKMKNRDEKYRAAREAKFPKAVCSYYRELSIDELPGLTTPLDLAVVLSACDAMGMGVDYVAPAFGFQKNFPFEDAAALEDRVSTAYQICSSLGVSVGFHSGSGKSAENYQTCGRVTGGNLEIKTSGRYTYEMGVALAASSDPTDQALWADWVAFTKEMAIASAFAENSDERDCAREFILESIPADDTAARDSVFTDPAACRAVIEALAVGPDSMLWFEYNFLFVLAAGGAPDKAALGDHSAAGYTQRARFYAVSEEGALLFAKGVARYILFLAETTGMSPSSTVATARDLLDSYTSLVQLTTAICPEDLAPAQTIVLADVGSFKSCSRYVPVLPLNSDSAIVEVQRVGLCGTDYKGVEGQQPFLDPPRVLGHELCVRVVALPGGASEAGGLSVGDLCAVEPYLNCQNCGACAAGKSNCCGSLQVLGVHVDGGMCERMEIRLDKLHRSTKLSPNALALVEPLCVGAHAVSRGSVTADDTVLVVGAGPIGTSVAIFAAFAGAAVTVCDLVQDRLDKCAAKLTAFDNVEFKLGTQEETRGKGTAPSVIVDATGYFGSMEACLETAAVGARIVYVGLCRHNISFWDPLFHKKELTLLASRNAVASDFRTVIEAAEAERIDLESWVTHECSLSEFESTFESWTLPESNVLKAVVRFA